MEKLVQIAKKIALQQGYHAPQLILIGEKGGVPITLMDFPNEYEEKLSYLFDAGKDFSNELPIGKLILVYFIMEAWMGTNIAIRPSRDPNRIEVLLVSCFDILKNEQTGTALQYMRNAKGKLIDIKDISIPHGTTAESPLFRAFIAGYNKTV